MDKSEENGGSNPDRPVQTNTMCGWKLPFLKLFFPSAIKRLHARKKFYSFYVSALTTNLRLKKNSSMISRPFNYEVKRSNLRKVRPEK